MDKINKIISKYESYSMVLKSTIGISIISGIFTVVCSIMSIINSIANPSNITSYAIATSIGLLVTITFSNISRLNIIEQSEK